VTKSKKLANKNIRGTWKRGIRESASDLVKSKMLALYLKIIGYELQF